MLNMKVNRASSLIDEEIKLSIRSSRDRGEVGLRAEALDDLGQIWRTEKSYPLKNGRLDLDLGDLLMESRYARTRLSKSLPFALPALVNLVSRICKGGTVFRRKFTKFTGNPLQITIELTSAGEKPIRRSIDLQYSDQQQDRVSIQQPFCGTYYPAARGRKSPAILVLGGSAGGLLWSQQMAALLSGRGFHALAVSYFDYRGGGSLPRELCRIPLEYLHSAVDWLKSQADVDENNIGALGLSKGSEAILLYDSLFPRSLEAIVAYSPPAYSFEGVYLGKQRGCPSWTIDKRDIPFLAYPGDSSFSLFMKDGAIRKIHEEALGQSSAHAISEALIDIGKSDGKMLLISGGLDGTWPSREMCRLLKSKDRKNRIVHVDYPKAGHVFLPPNTPPYIDSPDVLENDAYSANSDAWNRVKQFFKMHLIE